MGRHVLIFSVAFKNTGERVDFTTINNGSSFGFRTLLLLTLLAAGGGAQAADVDGDGFLDAPLVSAGGTHTCALDDDGVHCWGRSFEGQIAVPVMIHPVAVSAGGEHTCALDSTGVHCWGLDLDGQTTVPALVNPVAISAGGWHSCALDDNGVHCWGDGRWGQTAVPALTHPVAVSAGANHSCALDDTGVHCWGDNTFGQLSTQPVLLNPVAVSANGSHTCALDSTGLHCWGDAYGQVAVPALADPSAVSAGGEHVCALDAAGLHCWGGNNFGQITVPALVDPVAVSAGYEHTCAVDVTGVHCWGRNIEGETTVPVPFSTDNCPGVTNTDQLDNDSDGVGDACDPDIDGDGVANASDAFPLDPTETTDMDGDNLGDNSDPLPNDANTLGNYPGAAKSDRAGASVAYAGDFNGDGYGDYIIGIPGFDVSSKIKDAGMAQVISGKNGHVLKSVSGAVAKDMLGAAVAGNADINNDGFDDVIVGAPNAGANHSGSVTILFGHNGGVAQTSAGAVAKSRYGFALALGDVDGDSHADILVGAPGDDDIAKKLTDSGSVTVVSGANNTTVLATFYGNTDRAYAGAAVASGDLDGDGSADIVIGAPNDTGGGSVTAYNLAGAVFWMKSADIKGARYGAAVASGDDVDGDSRDDVIVGAPGDDDLVNQLKDCGSITAYSGGTGGFLQMNMGGTAKAMLGNSVALGDVNADGYADLIAGTRLDDSLSDLPATKDTGSVSVWSATDNSDMKILYGTAAKDYFGSAVSAGDINHDGKADLIIGIPGLDITAVKPIKDAGAVKIVSGASL